MRYPLNKIYDLATYQDLSSWIANSGSSGSPDMEVDVVHVVDYVNPDGPLEMDNLEFVRPRDLSDDRVIRKANHLEIMRLLWPADQELQVTCPMGNRLTKQRVDELRNETAISMTWEAVHRPGFQALPNPYPYGDVLHDLYHTYAGTPNNLKWNIALLDSNANGMPTDFSGGGTINDGFLQGAIINGVLQDVSPSDTATTYSNNTPGNPEPASIVVISFSSVGLSGPGGGLAPFQLATYKQEIEDFIENETGVNVSLEEFDC
jgi:hypothetical protein